MRFLKVKENGELEVSLENYFHTGLESGHVDECDEWDVEGIAEANKSGTLDRCIDVQDTFE